MSTHVVDLRDEEDAEMEVGKFYIKHDGTGVFIETPLDTVVYLVFLLLFLLVSVATRSGSEVRLRRWWLCVGGFVSGLMTGISSPPCVCLKLLPFIERHRL